MAIRPAWIDVKINDTSKFSGGPQARNGSLSASLSVRQAGDVLPLLDIVAIGSNDQTNTRIRITDKRNGRIIFQELFAQDGLPAQEPDQRKPITQAEAEKLVAEAVAKFQAEISLIAERVRQDRLIPYLDKHGYDFIAGMGTWAIGKPGGESFDHDELPKTLTDFLDIDVCDTYFSSLGEEMSAYPENSK